MAIATHDAIAKHAATIATLATRRGTDFTKAEGYNLRALANMCGYPDTAPYVRAPDLQEVLKAALRSPAQGIMVTARVARANGVPIADAPAPFDPFGEPAPAPLAPVAPPGGVSMDDVQRACRLAEENAKGYAESLADNAANDARQYADGLLDGLPGMVADQVTKALQGRVATDLIVHTPGNVPLPIGLVHYQTPRIIRALANGLNVYLHGPAGSGKTTVGKKAAVALGLPFYTTAKVESEYLLLGFRNAQGETVRTPFRDAYEHGGVFLFDELDASSPGAIVALNMALANGVCPFPDGLIQRHENFHCIGAGNTTLGGANRQYAGRNQLDGASVDRFYFVEFPYDEALEMELATNKAWCVHVQNIRRAVKERGLTHLVTPRATFDGCKALAMGDTVEEAEMSCIFKGLDKETVLALRNAVPKFRTPDLILDA